MSAYNCEIHVTVEEGLSVYFRVCARKSDILWRVSVGLFSHTDRKWNGFILLEKCILVLPLTYIVEGCRIEMKFVITVTTDFHT
jgi:hypothetical protein